MAKKISAKKPLSGNKRSHALNATKRVQNVNLQSINIDGKNYRVSARELRSLRKTEKVAE